MIVTMEKVRVIGPRDRLDATLCALLDVGTLHLCEPELSPPLAAATPEERDLRHERTVLSALDDVEEALSHLALDPTRDGAPPSTPSEPLSREVWLARRARRRALRLSGELQALADRREELRRLKALLDAFAELERKHGVPGRHLAYLVLAREHASGLQEIERRLRQAIGGDFAVHTSAIAGGQLAVMLEVPAAQAELVAALLPEAGVGELELPVALHHHGPRAAAEEIGEALTDLERRHAALEDHRRALARWLQPGLSRARASLHDWLIVYEAGAKAAATRRLFVLEGWVPSDARPGLEQALHALLGATVVVEVIGQEHWTSPDAPVAIRNPPLLRPFEVITRRLPSPRYGTLDPTPFVGVFFPIFFGLILGDVGYGAMLAIVAALLWWRSRPQGTLRAVSQIATACAVFSILFGLVFGELFGDLGDRLLGLKGVSFSREKAVVPFLILSVSIGFVHVVLGLVLGAVSGMRSEPRKSLGRGLTAVMLVLTATIGLAAANVLPGGFFKPAVVALLLAFPLLVLLEGFLGPVELLARVSNILSYARIMALGTASVMLAVVANEMVGALGGAVVGVIFATLFHLVNFGLGVFSPTIHALRLHFVEFFGTFYSPGDQVYQPLRHWRSSTGVEAPQST